MDEVKHSRDSKAEQRVQRLKANRHEVYLNNLRGIEAWLLCMKY